MNDTPRTEAKTQVFGRNPDESEEFVPSEFARELERENTALRAKVAEQGLSLACLADEILGENAADRRDQTLVAVGCQMARQNAELKLAFEAAIKYQRDLKADRDRLDWIARQCVFLAVEQSSTEFVRVSPTRDGIDAAMEIKT